MVIIKTLSFVLPLCKPATDSVLAAVVVMVVAAVNAPPKRTSLPVIVIPFEAVVLSATFTLEVAILLTTPVVLMVNILSVNTPLCTPDNFNGFDPAFTSKA